MKLIIEQQIWEYLDSSCSPEKFQEVEELIHSDPEYYAAYQELLEIRNQLGENDLETPPLGFTRNLMEKIKAEPIPGSIKALVDKKIIYTITVFFLTSILAGLILLLLQFDWQGQPQESWTMQFPEIRLSTVIKDWIIKGFLFLDSIIVLYAVDFMLRKKLLKQS